MKGGRPESEMKEELIFRLWYLAFVWHLKDSPPENEWKNSDKGITSFD